MFIIEFGNKPSDVLGKITEDIMEAFERSNMLPDSKAILIRPKATEVKVFTPRVIFSRDKIERVEFDEIEATSIDIDLPRLMRWLSRLYPIYRKEWVGLIHILEVLK